MRKKIMDEEFEPHYVENEKGNVVGGTTMGHGFVIRWHSEAIRGVGLAANMPVSQNGAFPEDVIAAIIDYIQHSRQGLYDFPDAILGIELLQEAKEKLTIK